MTIHQPFRLRSVIFRHGGVWHYRGGRAEDKDANEAFVAYLNRTPPATSSNGR